MADLLSRVLPVAGMGLAACLLMLLSAVIRRGRTIGFVALAALLLLGGAPIILLWGHAGRPIPESIPPALLSSDGLALFFDGLFVLAAALVAVLSLDYFEKKESHHAELYGLIALSATGMMVLASATNLITFYLGLETMSIAFYVLAGFLRSHQNSVEASLKYFLLGAFSSAFLLLGMAFLYGSSGSLDFGGLAAAFSTGIYPLGEPALLLGFFLFLVGLFFKLSLIPFHFWAPDVYQGSPTPITALMAVGGKTAAAAGAIRIFLSSFAANPLLAGKWLILFTGVGLLSIFVGSMVALTQRHMKRLLAYSSIVHAGFLALGIGALAVPGISKAVLEALLFYLAAYLFMNVGAFAVAAIVERKPSHDETLLTYSGLASGSPWLAALLSLFMFSLAGIPLTAGFLGKFYLFRALVNGGFYWIAALGLVGAVIATYYYLKVVVALYFSPPPEEPNQRLPVGTASRIALAVAAFLTLCFGVFPGLLMGLISGLGIG